MADERKIITIRRGQPADAVAIFRLLEQAYGDADAPYPPLDEHKLMVWIADTLSNGEVWVADRSGRVLGSLALIDFWFPWSAHPVLSNRWLYVIPAFRKRGTGDSLIEAAIRSADAKGAPLVLATHSGRDTAMKDQFIETHGDMTYAGGMFFRPAQPVQEAPHG